MSFNAPVTFNAPMFDIHDNRAVYIAGEGQQKDVPSSYEKQEVINALVTLRKTTDKEGGYIFKEKGQWYAVYRVMSEYLGYPKDMRIFCNVMIDMGMCEVQPIVSYECMRKVPLNVHLPPGKVALWSSYLTRADEKARKQIVVAEELIRILGV